MAERQISHESPLNENFEEEEEGEVDSGQSTRQTRFSFQTSQSNSRASSDNGADREVKDLLQIMVKQQQAQCKKLDMLQSQIDSASSKVDQVAMKIHSEDKKSFRKKGIEFQYRHNAQVISNYDELEMVVAVRKYDLLPRLIDAGKSFVLQRQRTLTFADEKGWVFVEVYEADNIALDSEDDRKIKKCEKRAKELIDQRYKKKQKTSNYRQNTNFNTADRRQFNSNTDSGYRQMGSNKSGSGWNQGGYIPNSQRRPGARNECYNCGSLKHFVNECPDRGDRSASRENKCELAILGTIEKFVPLSEVYKSMSHDFIPPVFVDTVYEFESITGVDISVVGRLKRGLQFMRNIQASPYICDIIDKGYVIPFVGQPSSKFFRNNASSRKHPKFVRESIDKLIYQGRL